MKSILLLEDDLSLGATLSERVLKEGYDVFWAKNLAEARSQLLEKQFDLAVLDVGLPDGSGFELAKEIREASLMPFIFVTALGSAEDRLKGYEIGAEEYIPKPFHLKELLMRVEHVLNNHSHDLVKVGEVELDLGALEVRSPKALEKLSFKEAALLKLLIERSPKPVTRDDILNRIWGEEEYPSNRTVDNMVLKLRQIADDALSIYIHSVRGVGYKWSEKGESDGQ